jgi:hypothetical protein
VNGDYYTQHYLPKQGQRAVLFPICATCFVVKPGSKEGHQTKPIHIAEMETEMMIPVVRTSTPPPKAFRKTVLVAEQSKPKEKPTFTAMMKNLMKKGVA